MIDYETGARKVYDQIVNRWESDDDLPPLIAAFAKSCVEAYKNEIDKYCDCPFEACVLTRSRYHLAIGEAKELREEIAGGQYENAARGEYWKDRAERFEIEKLWELLAVASAALETAIKQYTKAADYKNGWMAGMSDERYEYLSQALAKIKAWKPK